MQTTKFKLAMAHLYHYTESVLVAGFAGCFMPVFLMVVLGAGTAEKYHAPQLFNLDIVASQVVYGLLAAVISIVATKGYLIRGAISYWLERERQHRMDIDHMKYGPVYFRK